jgi:hypothetical protein
VRLLPVRLPTLPAVLESVNVSRSVLARHIPAQERLPTDVTAPCLAHLLNATTVDSSPAKPSNRPTSEKKRSKRSRGEPAEKCSSGPSRDEAEYSTPW